MQALRQKTWRKFPREYSIPARIPDGFKRFAGKYQIKARFSGVGEGVSSILARGRMTLPCENSGKSADSASQ
jgi:hypothetical protein